MVSGTVTFNCQLKCLNIPAFDHTPAPPSLVLKVEILCHEKTGLDFIAHVSGATDVNAAVQGALAEVSELADRIAFHIALVGNGVLGIGQPVMTGYNLGTSVSSSLALSVSGSVTFTPGDVQQLLDWLKQTTPAGLEYLPAFHTALDSGDATTQYMGLYHLLMILGHDEQKLVDKFIKQEEGSRNFARTRPKRDDPSVLMEESKYTRLRNEFSHRRPGVNILTTRSEMSTSLSDLVKVTKAAVQRMRPSPPHPKIKRNCSQRLKKRLGL